MYHRFKWTQVSNRRNWISREYEPLQPYFILELARAAGSETFVDVGANIGLYSVVMSQLVNEVIAYEANEALVKEIKGNFSLNSIQGSVRQAAVSDQAGSVDFGIVSRYAGNSAVVERSYQTEDYNSVETVEAVRLDDELASLAGPIAIKIDVEGHELSVLEGAKSTLENKSCIIQIENFGGAVDHFMSDLNYRKLTDIGPDSYFTNIDILEPVEIYEKAAAALIHANHENKSMILGKGDVGVVIAGRPYQAVKKLAQKVLGSRL